MSKLRNKGMINTAIGCLEEKYGNKDVLYSPFYIFARMWVNTVSVEYLLL